ncbi:hypothetical protein P7K49_014301 [Saguinus oedipus]|uniref:Uncharacterized protein n=1 Tax=Saguinus oedipus TaxID=9490 RepID=A0ABQ9VID2_SAGOE|nr:hypothetical protein P7K49_014301 [Saguinus oedipus]
MSSDGDTASHQLITAGSWQSPSTPLSLSALIYAVYLAHSGKSQAYASHRQGQPQDLVEQNKGCTPYLTPPPLGSALPLNHREHGGWSSSPVSEAQSHQYYRELLVGSLRPKSPSPCCKACPKHPTAWAGYLVSFLCLGRHTAFRVVAHISLRPYPPPATPRDMRKANCPQQLTPGSPACLGLGSPCPAPSQLLSLLMTFPCPPCYHSSDAILSITVVIYNLGSSMQWFWAPVQAGEILKNLWPQDLPTLCTTHAGRWLILQLREQEADTFTVPQQ